MLSQMSETLSSPTRDDYDDYHMTQQRTNDLQTHTNMKTHMVMIRQNQKKHREMYKQKTFFIFEKNCKNLWLAKS